LCPETQYGEALESDSPNEIPCLLMKNATSPRKGEQDEDQKKKRPDTCVSGLGWG
jgi:hypothetical protein